MIGFSIMIMLQLTRYCQAVSGPEINKWNGAPTLFPWFGLKWLLAVTRNKVCLEGMKISRHWRYQKNMTMVLKAIPQGEFHKCSHQWQHCWAKCIATQGEYLKSDPSQ
jgi:hypothetical protein